MIIKYIMKKRVYVVNGKMIKKGGFYVKRCSNKAAVKTAAYRKMG